MGVVKDYRIRGWRVSLEIVPSGAWKPLSRVVLVRDHDGHEAVIRVDSMEVRGGVVELPGLMLRPRVWVTGEVLVMDRCGNIMNNASVFELDGYVEEGDGYVVGKLRGVDSSVVVSDESIRGGVLVIGEPRVRRVFMSHLMGLLKSRYSVILLGTLGGYLRILGEDCRGLMVILPVDMGRLGRVVEIEELHGYVKDYLLSNLGGGLFRFRVRASRGMGIEYRISRDGFSLIVKPISIDFSWILRRLNEPWLRYLYAKTGARDLESLIEGIEEGMSRGADWLRVMDREHLGRLIPRLHWLRDTGLFDVKVRVGNTHVKLSTAGLSECVLVDLSNIPEQIVGMYILGFLEDVRIKAGRGLAGVVVMIDDVDALGKGSMTRLLRAMTRSEVGYVIGSSIMLRDAASTRIILEDEGDLIGFTLITRHPRSREIRGVLDRNGFKH